MLTTYERAVAAKAALCAARSEVEQTYDWLVDDENTPAHIRAEIQELVWEAKEAKANARPKEPSTDNNTKEAKALLSSALDAYYADNYSAEEDSTALAIAVNDALRLLP